MGRVDPFTQRRLLKFIEDHRHKTGQLPTLQDLEAGSFSRDIVDAAIKDKLIEMLYVTLTNGTVMKGFKIVISTPFDPK